MYNLIKDCKDKKYINNRKFMLKYNTINEGLYIIGSEFKDVIDNYDENKTSTIKLIAGTGIYKFKFKINKVQIGDDNVTIDTLGQFDNLIEITDKSKIKIIYYMFEGKKSNEESSGDNPENPDKLYSVSFNTEHNKRSIFMYKKDDKYYIEEANEGLYESSEEDFEKLEGMLKDNDYKYKIDNYKTDDIKKVVISSMGQFDEPVELTDNRNISGVIHCFYQGVRITAFDSIID